jgi:hypothetical protein
MRKSICRAVTKPMFGYQASCALLFLLFATVSGAQHALTIERLDQPSLPSESTLFPKGTVILDGLSASAFRPDLWQADTLHWVPDLAYPLFSALPGHSRNIYAASTVEEPWGWRIYYSAWDGVPTGNDRLYEGKTRDGFLTIQDRKMVVDHGEFKHVSNASAQKLADGSYELLGTSEGSSNPPGDLPGEKPAVFESRDGDHFDGDLIPYQAEHSDNLRLNYPEYDKDHFNGANVLFRDSKTTRFLFHEWSHDRRSIYWAEGKDPWHLKVGGIALGNTILAPNDLRKFTVGGKDWYLLALYHKSDVSFTARDSEHVWYSLSNDGRSFSAAQPMVDAQGRADRFIFSVNFVSQGPRLLGILYGSSENAACDKNSIFATWIQKRAVLVALPGYHVGNGGIYPGDGALGPDRQRFTLPAGKPFDGRLDLFEDDGKTAIGLVAVHLEPGNEYRIHSERQ